MPVDRHVFAKRFRAWINADGFISPLNIDNLVDFEPGPPAHWRFVANAGDGRSVEIRLLADLLQDRNTVVLHFTRPNGNPTYGHVPCRPTADVRIILRVDLEDRNFHCETQRNGGADHHLALPPTRPLAAPAVPLRSRTGPARLRVWTDSGTYQSQPEWSENHLPHTVESSRGHDRRRRRVVSPGWFELPLAPGASATVTASVPQPMPRSSPRSSPPVSPE